MLRRTCCDEETAIGNYARIATDFKVHYLFGNFLVQFWRVGGGCRAEKFHGGKPCKSQSGLRLNNALCSIK